MQNMSLLLNLLLIVGLFNALGAAFAALRAGERSTTSKPRAGHLEVPALWLEM